MQPDDHKLPPPSPSQPPPPSHLLSLPPEQPDHYNYSLPLLGHHPRRHRHGCALTVFAVVVIIVVVALFIWPQKPIVAVSKFHLRHIHVAVHPHVTISLRLQLRLRFINPNHFSFKYDYVDTLVSYRGRQLGEVDADGGGQVVAEGTSYMDAEVDVDGMSVIHEAVHLMEDVARKAVPLETTTQLKGTLGISFLSIPIEGKIECGMVVNPEQQSIISQQCRPADH